MEIGRYNLLEVVSVSDHGIYLTDKSKKEVLLPNKFVPAVAEIGDRIRIFLYRDSEDRLVATTQTPRLTLGQFGFLRAKDVSKFGAFMDWGLDKDLLVPFKEQKQEFKVGNDYLVYLYLDPETHRLVGTTKLRRHFKEVEGKLTEGQEVNLLAWSPTDLGYNVIVDQSYLGLIYSNEVFREISPGDEMTGYVKKIREDGKLDISLQRAGLDQLEDGAAAILKALKKAKGSLPLHDKSSPEEIREMLGMSKKNFKRSLGILYKKRMVEILEKEIRLR